MAGQAGAGLPDEKTLGGFVGIGILAGYKESLAGWTGGGPGFFAPYLRLRFSCGGSCGVKKGGGVGKTWNNRLAAKRYAP